MGKFGPNRKVQCKYTGNNTAPDGKFTVVVINDAGGLYLVIDGELASLIRSMFL